MTIRDPEILDVLRDEPELLAIADAVGETQKLPRRRWVVPGSLAAVGVAAAAVALAILFWPGGGSHPILDRARAAVGDGPVLHTVIDAPTGNVLVNLSSGRRVVERFVTESWVDRDGSHIHMIERSGGAVVGDILLPNDKRTGSVGSVSSGPAYDALWTGYRRALESGAAKVVGTARIYGHDVYWIRFPASTGLTESDVAIDRDSYKPVAFRVGAPPQPVLVTRVLTFETTSFRPSDFQRVGPSLIAGATSHGGGSESPQAPRSAWPRILRAPWLTLGPSFGGSPLTSVGTMTATYGDRTVRGVRLVYGRSSISELGGPDDPAAWRGIPAGDVRIEVPRPDSGRRLSIWTGSLVRDGVYVTIESRAGERAVVAIARALRRA